MLVRRFGMAGVLAGIFGAVSVSFANTMPVPAPMSDLAPVAGENTHTAVFAGGCFWGVEAVFRSVKGVSRAVSGYAGGTTKSPSYEMVSSGSTGHAEAVEVTFDPTKVTYGQLLRVFFSVAHDPTQLNRQGPDSGTQYRSAIFYTNEAQQRVARAYVAQLTAAKAFERPIVTQIAPLATFYPAEAYHQNYLALHPTQPYIVYNDLPKLDELKKQFPGMYAAY
ncbi:MAG: peptide-methionine (S)-S-oxide reductase MsrA [Casimicrobiaceae bacterium]